MAYTTINKSTDYFNTKLYTGNGSAGNAITGVGFQPDWLWIKNRGQADWHQLFNSVRGASYVLYSNETSAESSASSSFASFDSDGFTVNANDGTNGNGENLVAWNWKANGTGSANTDGSINSTVSANTTAGFSIVYYTGNSTSGATVGHGLGVVPKMIIVKLLSGSDNWTIYHSSLGNTKRLELNNANASATSASAGWNNTSPTTSVFSLGNNGQVNGSGQTYIAYCFAEKTGYSKFGSYKGNGSADGTFVYTGFRPNWVMIKETNGSGAWRIFDNKRPGYNEPYALMADVADAAETGTSRNKIDQLSNGFKLRMQYDDTNGSSGEYVYMAFGQSMVGSNNVPCTAR